MKFTKFLVLGAGIVGLISFFLPLLSFKIEQAKFTVSAKHIVLGIDSLDDVVDGVDTDGTEALAADFNKKVEDIKMPTLLIYLPAFVLLLFGGIGVLRTKFGRGFGAGSLIFGLIGLAFWFILNDAAEDEAGLGLHLLMLVGLLGTIGGLLALIKPDRGQTA